MIHYSKFPSQYVSKSLLAGEICPSYPSELSSRSGGFYCELFRVNCAGVTDTRSKKAGLLPLTPLSVSIYQISALQKSHYVLGRGTCYCGLSGSCIVAHPPKVKFYGPHYFLNKPQQFRFTT